MFNDSSVVDLARVETDPNYSSSLKQLYEICPDLCGKKTRNTSDIAYLESRYAAALFFIMKSCDRLRFIKQPGDCSYVKAMRAIDEECQLAREKQQQISCLPIQDTVWSLDRIFDHTEAARIVLVIQDRSSLVVGFTVWEASDITLSEQVHMALCAACLYPVVHKPRRPRYFCIIDKDIAKNCTLAVDRLGITYVKEPNLTPMYHVSPHLTNTRKHMSALFRECTVCRFRAEREMFHTCDGCGAMLYCTKTCGETDWGQEGQTTLYNHSKWCHRIKTYMDEEKQLVDLPFTFTTGSGFFKNYENPLWVTKDNACLTEGHRGLIQNKKTPSDHPENLGSHVHQSENSLTQVDQPTCSCTIRDQLRNPDVPGNQFGSYFEGQSGGQCEGQCEIQPADLFRDQFSSQPGCQLEDQSGVQCEDQHGIQSTDHYVGLSSGQSEGQCGGQDTLITDWASYYRYRGLSLDSPISVLLQWPLTLYYILTRCLPKDYGCELARDRPVILDILGVEQELDLYPVFQELSYLLPNHEFVINMFGKNISKVVDRCVKVMGRVKVKVYRCLYHNYKHRWKPDVAIGFNAGIAAYPSWRETISKLKSEQTPAYFTDYCHYSADLGREVMREGCGLEISLPSLNPFRSPLRRVCDQHLLPWFSNAYLFHLLYTPIKQ
ncbi:zinc finger MYND domain-containing protein 15-like isoform X2 [Ylistrum balloti]|uniref:zinc finger MYND domain-containing protein 15-like isoform X2 n=1 Tax=Ylistrum balloti TaxID=509963 RepID=UPI002905CBA9|nr:zinc finger MYND domain-containing protein 15-like isoform X2 [Ylistrum balloti]